MKARINRTQIISCLSTLAIVATMIPWNDAMAATSRRIASGSAYTKLKNKYNPTEYIEKNVDIYYLPALYSNNTTEWRNWTMPSSLPTSYTIPEWEDYTWNMSTSDVIYKHGGTYLKDKVDTVKWTNSDFPEETSCYTVYGVNDTTEICYKFYAHNYAYTLREQEMDKLIAKYIKPDMTDYEKVCTAAAIVSAGIYNSGDPILTKSGDCIDSAYAMVYLLRKLGITARSRMNDAPNDEGYNHHNNFVLIDGEIYVVDGTCHYKADTTLTYEQRVETEIKNINDSYNSNIYIKKINDHWSNLAGSTWFADNSCWYTKLDDGTIRLNDIFGLDGDTSEVWMFPTSTSINGTTYHISKIGNIGHWTYQSLSTDLNCKGMYNFCLPYRQLIVPEGIDMSEANISCCFNNVEQLTVNSTAKDIYESFSSDSIKAIDATNAYPTSCTSGTLYTNVTDVLKEFRLWYAGEGAGDCNICDVSNPNNHTIMGSVPFGVHNAEVTLTNSVGNIFYPLLDTSFKNFRFLGMEQGEYTLSINVDGYMPYTKNITLDDSDVNLGSVKIVEVHDHVYTSTVTTEPTCTKTGIRTYTCDICGDSYIEEIPAKGHSYQKTVTPPTCTKKGYTTYKCSACGSTYVSDYTDALGHNYVSKITKEATCTEAGVRTYTCSRCGDAYTEEIPAKGHHFKDTVVPPTETEQGYTLHVCTECGYSYKDNYTDIRPHTYTSEVTKEATCTEDGIRTYTCSDCGHTYTETIPATGHEFVDKVVYPTTTSEGYTEHTCSKCGYSYRDNYKDKLPEAHTHHYESKVAKEATCTESGVKTFTCPECGDTYDEVIPAKGHHWGTPSVTPATCTEDGEKVCTCIDCGETNTETIKATGHSFKNTVIEPTAETEGYTEHICSKCGYSYKDNYKPRLEKKNIANAAVSVSKTKYTYTGKAIKPEVTVTCDGKELIKDTDYTVSYKNCTDTGKATVTVKGKGNYEGSKSISYFIKPAKVKAKKFTSPKTKTVKLTWTKAEGNVTGYQVQIALNKKFTKSKKTYTITKNTSTSKTVKKLKKGKTYYARVRAYKTVGKTKYYGAWSTIKKVKTK